ncbi:hypothetical protein Peur_051155 [Populus x canadensis]
MSSSMLKVDDLSKRAEIMRGGKNSTLKHKETANTFAFRFLHLRQEQWKHDFLLNKGKAERTLKSSSVFPGIEFNLKQLTDIKVMAIYEADGPNHDSGRLQTFCMHRAHGQMKWIAIERLHHA